MLRLIDGKLRNRPQNAGTDYCKFNALVDTGIIAKLYEASSAVFVST